MGTDVYLEWKGKTKAEKEAQITGWSITAGSVGYLRASIGMFDENRVLRLLFDEKYWDGTAKTTYDFEGNFNLMEKVLLNYVQSGIDPNVVKDDELLQTMSKRNDAIVGFLKSLGDCEFKTQSMDNGSKIVWAKSVYDFFLLGREKQRQGKKPYPYISW